MVTLGGAVRVVVGSCLLGACVPKPARVGDCCAPTVTHAQASSVLYLADQEWLHRNVARLAIAGRSDTLEAYARKCDEATGIHVPAFDCDAGTEVPGQGSEPACRIFDLHIGRCVRSTTCPEPNVLNGECDPGSRFQVLPGGTTDAVAVAHCRKVGLPVHEGGYNDIAVIQYNKRNGAICFYQALSNLPSQVPAPLTQGTAFWPQGHAANWMSPAETEGIGCTGCHDNGGFIRSEYIAQLNTPPNELPSTGAGFNNLTTPVRYVGLDYVTNRSWSITTAPDPKDTGAPCTTCHRLAVPNRMAAGVINGTAARFANIATAQTQLSKWAHGSLSPTAMTSPIWMRPGQDDYKPEVEATATRFQNCATAFFNSGFASAPPDCTITPLGEPWTAPDAARFVSQTAAPTQAVAPSATFPVTVTFSNAGNTLWQGDHTMSIAPSYQTGAQIFAPQSFVLGTAQLPVFPGDAVSESFTVGVPAQPGTYDLGFIIGARNGAVLAASPTQQVVVAVPQTPVDNASVTVVFAPGSIVNGGPGAAATVMIRNTGTTSWTSPAYTLHLARGLRVSLPQTSLSLIGVVTPGSTRTVSFTVTCNGQGQGWFTAQMNGPQGSAFGQQLTSTVVCQ